MRKDPIVEETRKWRAQMYKEAGGTLEGLFHYLQEAQKTQTNPVVSWPLKRTPPTPDDPKS